MSQPVVEISIVESTFPIHFDALTIRYIPSPSSFVVSAIGSQVNTIIFPFVIFPESVINISGLKETA